MVVIYPKLGHHQKIVNHFPLCHNIHHEPENNKMHFIIHNHAAR